MLSEFEKISHSYLGIEAQLHCAPLLTGSSRECTFHIACFNFLSSMLKLTGPADVIFVGRWDLGINGQIFYLKITFVYFFQPLFERGPR